MFPKIAEKRKKAAAVQKDMVKSWRDRNHQRIRHNRLYRKDMDDREQGTALEMP